MATGTGDFALSDDELRSVARFAVESAQDVLAVFEAADPGDARPRAAIDAAWAFVDGGRRIALLRTTSLDAHRAAATASTEPAALAARAAGDAAAAAYLHPIAKATQVGHILRATASAARIAELQAEDDPEAGHSVLDDACRRASPILVDVLRRYPSPPTGRSRVSQLMVTLDALLRTPG